MTDDRYPIELFDDLPAQGDALAFEFAGLARALAGYALNPGNRTPFTVVIKGPWGRGKTTLLKATRSVLDEARHSGVVQGRRVPYTVEFNVWKYPDEDTILAGLLGALLDAMRTGPLKDQIKVAVSGRKGALLKGLLSTAAPWLDIQGPRFDVQKLCSSRFDMVDRKRAFHDTFRSLFAQLWLIWQDSKAVIQDLDHRDIETELRSRQEQKVLAVFLDDLDRCGEDRLRATLQALNLFLDIPGVCFFVGVDWQRVLAILAKSPLEGRAESFMEKIVQVAFDLPEVTDEAAAEYSRSLLERRRLGDLLKEPLEAEGPAGAPRPIETLGAVLAENHPRHVKRVLNDLSMLLSALDHTGKLRGPGNADGVPPGAVIALHLVREKCTPGLRAQLNSYEGQGLRSLLTEWRRHSVRAQDVEAGMKGTASDEGDVTGGDWAPLFDKAAKLAPSLRYLASLDGEVLERLVHHGVPSRERHVAERSFAAPYDLLDAEAGLIDIAGGTFQMGEAGVAEPVHKVTVSSFRIGRFPVTNAEYQDFVRALDYPPPEHWEGGKYPSELALHPVVHVSWSDAVAYCRWLSERAGGAVVQLPSEAQWEFASRGTRGRPYPWGPDDPTPERANFGDESRGTTPSGSYPSGRTPDGIEDMAGNVWNWCADWFGDYVERPQQDPRGPERGRRRVMRGAAFRHPVKQLHSAYRYHMEPDRRFDDVGFRVVLVPSEGN